MDTFSAPLMLGLLVLVAAVVSFVWLCALIDCLRSDFRRSGDKIAWLLAILLLPVLGSVLYWCFAKKGRGSRRRHGHKSRRHVRHASAPSYAKIAE